MENTLTTPLAISIITALKAIDIDALVAASTDDRFDIISDVIDENISISHTLEIEKLAVSYFYKDFQLFGHLAIFAYFAHEHNLSSILSAILSIEEPPFNSEFEDCDATDIGQRIHDTIADDIKQCQERYYKVSVNFIVGDTSIPHVICVSASEDANNLHVRVAASIKDGKADNTHDQSGFESESGQLYIPISYKEITFQDFKLAKSIFDIEHYTEADLLPNTDHNVIAYLAF